MTWETTTTDNSITDVYFDTPVPLEGGQTYTWSSSGKAVAGGNGWYGNNAKLEVQSNTTAVMRKQRLCSSQ